MNFNLNILNQLIMTSTRELEICYLLKQLSLLRTWVSGKHQQLNDRCCNDDIKLLCGLQKFDEEIILCQNTTKWVHNCAYKMR